MRHPIWRYVFGGHGDKCASRLYRDNELGAQMEVYTRRRANGDWLEGKRCYFIDGDDREFRDEADMMEALESRDG